LFPRTNSTAGSAIDSQVGNALLEHLGQRRGVERIMQGFPCTGVR
jgi:hypothetical protein